LGPRLSPLIRAVKKTPQPTLNDIRLFADSKTWGENIFLEIVAFCFALCPSLAILHSHSFGLKQVIHWGLCIWDSLMRREGRLAIVLGCQPS